MIEKKKKTSIWEEHKELVQTCLLNRWKYMDIYVYAYPLLKKHVSYHSLIKFIERGNFTFPEQIKPFGVSKK